MEDPPVHLPLADGEPGPGDGVQVVAEPVVGQGGHRLTGVQTQPGRALADPNPGDFLTLRIVISMRQMLSKICLGLHQVFLRSSGNHVTSRFSNTV